jgi:hypothetical protein
MSLVSSKNWSSLTGLSSRAAVGTTSVAAELWKKNSTVKELERQSRRWIKEEAAVFVKYEKLGGAKKVKPRKRSKVKQNPFEVWLKDAIYHYTVDFGFNKIMLLLKYLDTDNLPYAENRLAQEQYRKLDPILIGNTRVMAHITANCFYDRDLVVYRGMKDKRKSIMNFNDKKEAVEVFDTFRRLAEYEKELLSMFMRDVSLDAILVGEYLPKWLKDPADERTIDLLVERIKALNGDLDLQTRDLEQLVLGRGEAIRTETFMSTSLSIEHARRFMGKDCCLLEIHVPAGTPCFYVSPFSEYKGEDSEFELVLPPCANLVVKGRSRGITRIAYLGISDVARHRMTLDRPREFILRDMMDKIKIGKTAAYNLQNGHVGFTKICKEYKGTHAYSPLQSGYNLSTYTGDILQKTWDAFFDPKKWHWSPKVQPYIADDEDDEVTKSSDSGISSFEEDGTTVSDMSEES